MVLVPPKAPALAVEPPSVSSYFPPRRHVALALTVGRKKAEKEKLGLFWAWRRAGVDQACIMQHLPQPALTP